MNKVNFSKYLAEFIGTFAMVFAGCGAVVVSGLYALPPLAIPLVFGLTVAAKGCC